MARGAFRFMVATAAFAGATSWLAAGAGASPPPNAGRPAVQACIGTTFSSLATTQTSPGALGHGVSGFAQGDDGQPGLGDGVQVLQAGLVPDSTVPNTCNG